MNNHLHLVDMISSSFTGCMVAAIQHCINGMDTPMNLRCAELQGVVANPAYLDMMRRTTADFLAADPQQSFHPDHINSGQSTVWVDEIGAIGDGSIVLPTWNGKDEVNKSLSVLAIVDWKLFTFDETPQA